MLMLSLDQRRILKQAASFAHAVHDQDSSGHDWWHILRVTRLARIMSVMERADGYICELASLLHDVADEKLNSSKEEGYDRVRLWLDEAGTESSDRDRVLEIIGTMSFAGGSGQGMSTLEGRIVQDADRLDALGVIGIARTFAYSGWKGQAMFDPAVPVREVMTREQYRNEKSTAINHFSEKLLKLKDRMNTETGRLLAASRHHMMELYLKSFDQEWAFGNENYVAESPLYRTQVERIHIAFDESAAGSLRLAFRNRPGEIVITLPDDLMVGPLPDGLDGEQIHQRYNWFLSRYSKSDTDDDLKAMLVESAAAWLTWPSQLKDKVCIIWASDSASEQLGLRRLTTLLPDQTEAYVLNASHALSCPEIDYRRTGEIVSEKLEPLLDQELTKLTPEVMAEYRMDWERLVAEDGCLRLLHNGKLCTVDESFYDAFILECAHTVGARHGKFVRSARVVGEAMGKADQYISDVFIEYRVRELIKQGLLLYPEAWKRCGLTASPWQKQLPGRSSWTMCSV